MLRAEEVNAPKAFTVTPCSRCGGCTALVVAPPKYACVACDETGLMAEGGWANVPDESPDEAVRARLRALCEERPHIREFVRLAKHRLKLRVVG